MTNLTAEDIQEAICLGLTARASSAEAVATRLHCSVSTMHRRLRRAGTTFTAERGRAQADRAFMLLDKRVSVRRVAMRVGVSPDHLTVLVREHLGLTPRQIQRAHQLADRLGRTPRSRTELASFRAADRELEALLGGIDTTQPLASWARRLVLIGHRPEFLTTAFLADLRAAERQAHIDAQHAADAQGVGDLSECDLLNEQVDVNALLLAKVESRSNIAWRANQLRRARQQAQAPR